MSNNATVDLPNSSGQDFVIHEGEAMNIEGQLVDGDDVAISEANLVAFYLTLCVEDSALTIINSRQQQSIFDANNCVVNADGSFVLRLAKEDAIINSSAVNYGSHENHLAILGWQWNDGVADRKGVQVIRFRVQKVGKSPFP